MSQAIKNPIGVDVGFKHLAVLSSGKRYKKCSPVFAANQLAANHDLICTEARSPVLAKFDWFFDLLDEACAKHSRVHVYIDRYYPSTRTCSNCFFIREAVPLSVRTWGCNECFTIHDRDVNAAKNILRVGLSLHNQQSLKRDRRPHLLPLLKDAFTPQPHALTSPLATGFSAHRAQLSEEC